MAGENALSSVECQTQTVVNSAVITDIRVQLAKVDLMERVKICFTFLNIKVGAFLAQSADWDGGADERSEP